MVPAVRTARAGRPARCSRGAETRAPSCGAFPVRVGRRRAIGARPHVPHRVWYAGEGRAPFPSVSVCLRRPRRHRGGAMEDDGWARAMAPFYEGRDASHDPLRRGRRRHHRAPRRTPRPPSPPRTPAYAGAAGARRPRRQYRPTPRTRAAVRRALVGAASSTRRPPSARCIGERISSARARGGAPPADLLPVDVPLYLLVSDADMLEALGAVGVVRTSVYQSSRHGGAPAPSRPRPVRHVALRAHGAPGRRRRGDAPRRHDAGSSRARDERAWGGAPRCPAG